MAAESAEYCTPFLFHKILNDTSIVTKPGAFHHSADSLPILPIQDLIIMIAMSILCRWQTLL